MTKVKFYGYVTFLLFVLVALFLFVFALEKAMAMDWMSVNQSTIAWDPSTLEGGGAVPDGDQLLYRVYTRPLGSTEQTMVGETADTKFTVTFSTEGRFVVGVQAVRIPQGETTEYVSRITWSDAEDITYVPDPFGIVYYLNPSDPKGLTPK